MLSSGLLFFTALLHLQINDVQGDCQSQVQAKGGHGGVGQCVTGATTEGRVGTAATAAECLRQSAALWPLNQNDQDEAHRDDEEENGEERECDAHSC